MKQLDPETVVLGLGGNVGGDATILERFGRVVAAVEMWSTVRGSRVYRTAAIGPQQPDYLNAAIAVDAPEELAASELIREVLGIEQSLGRERGGETRWGPRPIDVDVLLWGTRRFSFRGPPALEVRTLGELRAAIADQRVDVTSLHIEGAPPAPHLLDR